MKLVIRKIRKIPVTLLGLVFVLVMACSKEEVNEGPISIPEDVANSFNTSVTNLSGFVQPEETSDPELIDEKNPERDTEDTALECAVKTFKASPGFDELLSLDPTTDVIYPGALLQGESIPTGEYIPITGDRAPITLSASLTNINGSPVVDIVDPKLSTVREGIKTILDQEVTGATPARVSFEITQVYSEQQLNVAIGANYRSAGVKVSTAIDFSNTTKRNKFVLKYLQTYYTIDMDLPDKPSDLFNSLPDLDALGATAPVFVSSVAYGRMVIYTIETNSSETEINAALSATFASTDGSVEANYKETIEESTIKGLIIGGSGSDAAQTINGPSEVFAFISEGGDYSKDSPGAPLAYKLRFIKQGTPVARTVLSTEYPVRTCDLAYPRFKITLNSLRIVDTPGGFEGSHLEIWGFLRGKVNMGSDVRVNWSRLKEDNLRVEGTHTINLGQEIEIYRPNYDSNFVELWGNLSDEDTSGDDFLGSRSVQIPLRELSIGIVKTEELTFDEMPNHDVRAKYSVQRIR